MQKSVTDNLEWLDQYYNDASEYLIQSAIHEIEIKFQRMHILLEYAKEYLRLNVTDGVSFYEFASMKNENYVKLRREFIKNTLPIIPLDSKAVKRIKARSLSR